MNTADSLARELRYQAELATAYLTMCSIHVHFVRWTSDGRAIPSQFTAYVDPVRCLDMAKDIYEATGATGVFVYTGTGTHKWYSIA